MRWVYWGRREGDRSVMCMYMCVCVCCIIWLCRTWIIDTPPRNRGPIPGNRGETDREFKLGGSISSLLAPCVRAPCASSRPAPTSCMHLQKRTNSPNTTTNNHWITRLKRRVIYELNVCASQSITRHEYFRVYPSPVFPSSRPINSSPTSSFLVQSLIPRRGRNGIGVFSRDNYPSMISPRTNRRGYGGKREREKMMEEKVRKKKRSEQFSAFSSTLLPPLVPLINFVYNRNEGRGWSRNPCTYIYIYIQRCTLGFNQSSKNL